MKEYILLVLLCTYVSSSIVSSYIDEDGVQIDHHVGQDYVEDEEGRLYEVNYDIHILGGNHIVNMDDLTGVSDIHCDISEIDMVVDFTHEEHAYNFYLMINQNDKDRFITGRKWSCNKEITNSTQMIRRVLKVEVKDKEVYLQTCAGKYEEAVKDGEIDTHNHQHTFCFGVNTKNCEIAKDSIPLYKDKYIDIECSNCFVGAKATIFMTLDVHHFKMNKIAAGFKDIAINGAFVMDMTAQASWSAGIDKIFRVVDHGVIISFNIGPLPISIWYEIPLHFIATAMIDAQAHATAGAKANWAIGDAYVEWVNGQGWHVAKPHPKFNFEKVLDGDFNFHGEGLLEIAPEFIIHVNQIIEAGIKVDPKLMAKVEGSKEDKQICADLSYQVKSDVHAGLHINIPFIHLKFDKTFGPYVIFDTGVRSIGHWCKKFKALE